MMGSRIRLSGPITFSAPVGPLAAVTSVSIPGSPPHVIATFQQGLRLELDVANVIELVRRLPESLASLKDVDCGGAVWGGDE